MVFFKPAEIDPPIDYTGTGEQSGAVDVPWPSGSAVYTHLTPDDIKTLIEGILSADPTDDTDILDAFFDFNLGVPGARDPFSNQFNMPDCGGLTVTACGAKIDDAAGTTITGETTSTLSSDNAVMETAAGKVTDTGPTAGTAVSPSDSLTYYVNPDPMPTMTATELDIADTLEDQNTGVVDDTNKKTIARTCARLMDGAGQDPEDCTGLPMFVVGRDARTPALNDLAGIVRNPSWALLNARDNAGLSRPEWYTNLGTPAPGCLTAERPANPECDEFPYWGTLQGYGGGLNTMTPSIRWTPKPENNIEGRKLGKFYSNNGPGVWPWRGCNLTKQAPGSVVPLPESTFIEVPIPFAVSIDTRGVCNKPPPPE
jgi:hypothetical protein